MAAKPTPAQKAATKAFIKALKVLKKSLETKQMAELLGITPSRLNDWLSGRRTPDEKAQAEVRAAAGGAHAELDGILSELFAFIAVTAPVDTAKD